MIDRDSASRGAAARRVLGVGLAISVAAHLAILLWPIERPAGSDQPRPDRSRRTPDALGGVTLETIAAEDAVEPMAPLPPGPGEPTPPIDDREDDASSTLVLEPTDPPTGALPPSPAARGLGPAFSDPRLWDRRSPDPATGEDFGLERDLAHYRMRKWAETDAARPRAVTGMTDWTTEGEDGRVWGLSPGRIHLGSWTIPTCGGSGVDPADCGFGLPPGRRDAYDDWMWRYGAIERQAGRHRIEALWKQRAAAIRGRRDAERGDTLRRR